VGIYGVVVPSISSECWHLTKQFNCLSIDLDILRENAVEESERICRENKERKSSIDAILKAIQESEDLSKSIKIKEEKNKRKDEWIARIDDAIQAETRRISLMVLPFDDIEHPQNLRITPLRVVPQHQRRPRAIVDYTFSGVNPDLLPRAPAEAMQFGRALDHILYKILHADPHHGPVHMIKVDLSNGFHRLNVQPSDTATTLLRKLCEYDEQE
jgi:hypothetical protein